MPPWQARASGEKINIVKRFARLSKSISAASHGTSPNSSRNGAIRNRSASAQESDNANPKNKLAHGDRLRGSRSILRDRWSVLDGKSIVKKSASEKAFSPLEVGPAVIDQLETLKVRLAGKKRAGEDAHTYVAAIDPDNTRWEAFEASIRNLIEEGSKQSHDRKLSTEQWDLYRKLYTTQIAGTSFINRLSPKAEVGRQLEFAYYNYILQSKTEASTSGDLVFNTIDDYTDLRYPTEWYATTRTTQRQIHLHVGPTNSGKTYNAIKRLEEAGNGFYCGPLRLLAHEVYARFQAKGIPCHLITGDDVRTDSSEDVKLLASTVEMVDTNKQVEVAVIDEIQMMAHEDRGWAWTRAFLGANAKEVHLCGETRVIPLIRELSASMGDTLQVHNYERLSPLKVMSKSLKGNLKLLRKGDCIVSFSVVGIHAMKKEIEKFTGRRVAIVYGSLPPETRTAQAELFNNPDNDYDFLVASDAIGMGLNLAVKRIIFESVYKHNGRMREVLSIPQIKQIAGRAGRYRTAAQGATADTTIKVAGPPPRQAIGLVTCMEEADLPIIQKALETEPEPIKAAGLLPPAEFVEEFAARLPKGLPFEYIFRRVCDVAKMHPRFKLSEVGSQAGIARVLDSVQDLTIKDRLCFTSSPANTRKAQEVELLVAYGKCVANSKPVTCVDLPEIPLEVLDEPMSSSREYLERLETLHRSLILYLWLSYRFVAIFKDREQAIHAKNMAEKRISETLTKFSHTAELKERMKAIKSRRIRNSNILTELDLGPSDEASPVLSMDEPNTEDINIKLTASTSEELISLLGEELDPQNLHREVAVLEISNTPSDIPGESTHPSAELVNVSTPADTTRYAHLAATDETSTAQGDSVGERAETGP